MERLAAFVMSEGAVGSQPGLTWPQDDARRHVVRSIALQEIRNFTFHRSGLQIQLSHSQQ